MRPGSLFIAILLLSSLPVIAQKKDTLHTKRMETLYTAAAGPSVAIGKFSQTHLAGISLEAGGLTQFRKKKTTGGRQLLLFSWSAAADYYWGRKEKTAGYTYQYKRYWLAHVYAGAAVELKKDLLLSLSAGPGIGQYNGNMKYNTGLQAALHYAIAKRYLISPAFKLMQEPGTDWLAAASVRMVLMLGRRK